MADKKKKKFKGSILKRRLDIADKLSATGPGGRPLAFVAGVPGEFEKAVAAAKKRNKKSKLKKRLNG